MKTFFLTKEEATRFKDIFGFSIAKFWSSDTGFDVALFRSSLPVKEDESLHTYLTNKCGRETARFIETLCLK